MSPTYTSLYFPQKYKGFQIPHIPASTFNGFCVFACVFTSTHACRDQRWASAVILQSPSLGPGLAYSPASLKHQRSSCLYLPEFTRTCHNALFSGIVFVLLLLLFFFNTVLRTKLRSLCNKNFTNWAICDCPFDDTCPSDHQVVSHSFGPLWLNTVQQLVTYS